MLLEQTIEKMNAMKLFGMRDALCEQTELSSYDPCRCQRKSAPNMVT